MLLSTKGQEGGAKRTMGWGEILTGFRDFKKNHQLLLLRCGLPTGGETGSGKVEPPPEALVTAPTLLFFKSWIYLRPQGNFKVP